MSNEAVDKQADNMVVTWERDTLDEIAKQTLMFRFLNELSRFCDYYVHHMMVPTYPGDPCVLTIAPTPDLSRICKIHIGATHDNECRIELFFLIDGKTEDLGHVWKKYKYSEEVADTPKAQSTNENLKYDWLTKTCKDIINTTQKYKYRILSSDFWSDIASASDGSLDKALYDFNNWQIERAIQGM